MIIAWTFFIIFLFFSLLFTAATLYDLFSGSVDNRSPFLWFTTIIAIVIDAVSAQYIWG